MRSGNKAIVELKKKVALANRILFHQGLADYHGHQSARIPGTSRFLIKPVLSPLGAVTSRDIIEVDIDEYKRVCEENWARTGSQVKKEIKMKIPPRETMIHAAIYEARPDVQSVVHTHQPLATAFSIAGVTLKPIYNQAAPFAPETPILPSPRLIYTVADGADVVRTLGGRKAMLLQGHGIITVGEGVEEATSNAVYLERTAYLQWVASCVGKPTLMGQPDIDFMKENMVARSYQAFAYLASLLPAKARAF